jgi:hypothetical protein
MPSRHLSLGPLRPLAAICLAAALGLCGCQWTRQQYDSLKGAGFPEWSEKMNGGARGNSPETKPSGFFTDRRSEQIEKSLGGGF